MNNSFLFRSYGKLIKILYSISILITLQGLEPISKILLLSSSLLVLGALLSFKWAYSYLNMPLKDIEIDLIWYVTIIPGIYISSIYNYLGIILVVISFINLFRKSSKVSSITIRQFPMKTLIGPLLFL